MMLQFSNHKHVARNNMIIAQEFSMKYEQICKISDTFISDLGLTFSKEPI
jgi:hypothetical protein